jgi:hypothetical protein
VFESASSLCQLALERAGDWWLARGTTPSSSRFLLLVALEASSLVLGGLADELVEVLVALRRAGCVSSVAVLGVRLM